MIRARDRKDEAAKITGRACVLRLRALVSSRWQNSTLSRSEDRGPGTGSYIMIVGSRRAGGRRQAPSLVSGVLGTRSFHEVAPRIVKIVSSTRQPFCRVLSPLLGTVF